MCNKNEPPPVLSSAPPPFHSIALLGTFIAVFIRLLPSIENLDEVATVDTFTNVIFPQYIDLMTLGYIRLIIALSIWCTSFHTVFISKGWEQKTAYLKGSKLRMVPNKLKGLKTMAPFTSWSWNLLGISFTLNAIIAFQVAANEQVHPWLLRSAMLVWEVAAPFTLLVAAVIRYAIWPANLRAMGDTVQLRHPRNVMMHNMNVLFALCETALLGGLPVRWKDISLAPLVGCAYVIFTWCMPMRWNKPEHGPQYTYFFLDTTLPGFTPSIALLALLVVLVVFYGVFCTAEVVLGLIDGGPPVHLGFVVAVCSSVMRFRD